MEYWQLEQMQELPLEVKVQKSLIRIREWYEYFNGDVCVGFSGGKDSTVLLHLVRSIYPDVPAVFVNTGLEFPENVEFVNQTSNVITIRPNMNFRQVIENYGYPVISKEQADYISCVQLGYKNAYERHVLGIKANGDINRSYTVGKKWRFLLDAPFKIGARCCRVMKKTPFAKWGKKHGMRQYIGTLAGDSVLRLQSWLKYGCNAFDNTQPVSRPMSFWRDEDVWEYLRANNIPYSRIYDMGYARTGCIFCMFGVHKETLPNRFQLLQKTHPKLHEYCMRDWDSGGLGLRQVLEYINVPWEIGKGCDSSERAKQYRNDASE